MISIILKINDIYGHHQGDQVLIEIAQCLSENLRNEDIIGRFGGEEFILLLPHTDIIQAEKIAERCRQALQELTIFNNQNIQIHVSASFGISSSAFANDPYLVIRQADQALYAVRPLGVIKYALFTNYLRSNQFESLTFDKLASCCKSSC